MCKNPPTLTNFLMTFCVIIKWKISILNVQIFFRSKVKFIYNIAEQILEFHVFWNRSKFYLSYLVPLMTTIHRQDGIASFVCGVVAPHMQKRVAPPALLNSLRVCTFSLVAPSPPLLSFRRSNEPRESFTCFEWQHV